MLHSENMFVTESQSFPCASVGYVRFVTQNFSKGKGKFPIKHCSIWNMKTYLG